MLVLVTAWALNLALNLRRLKILDAVPAVQLLYLSLMPSLLAPIARNVALLPQEFLFLRLAIPK